MDRKVMEKRIHEFVDSIQTSYFNLGALLLRVREEGLFVSWEGTEYETFEGWCEEVLKFHIRKAQHLITIYKGVTDLNPPGMVMRRLLNLGWVKVGQILRVATTLPQLLKWIKIAEGLSLRELQGKVNFELAQSGDTPDEEAIATADASVLRRFRLTEAQNEHLDKALDILSKRFPSQADGERLDMMVMAFMSSHVRDDEGGLAVELGYLISGLEKAYGVKLKVGQMTAAPDKGTKKLKKAAG
jgi:hypothetical protein